MTSDLKKIIISGLLLTFLTSCAQLTRHADMVKPTAELTGAHIASISFDKVDLLFNLAVKNNNPLELDLAGMDYDFKIENQTLVSGVTSKAIKLKANATSPVQLPVSFKFDDLNKLKGKTIWNRNKLKYQFDTTINITLPVIGNYAVPVSKTGEVPVPKIPGIKLKNISVQKLSFTTADILATVEVNNPNDFKLVLNKLNYKLNINNQKWGSGKLINAGNIPVKGKGTIDIPITLDLMTAGSTVLSLLQNQQSMNYQLTGDANIDTGLELLQGYQLPIDISGTTQVK